MFTLSMRKYLKSFHQLWLEGSRLLVPQNSARPQLLSQVPYVNRSKVGKRFPLGLAKC